MGRLELVLSLTCFLAAASAAQVRESPAEGWGLGQRPLNQVQELEGQDLAKEDRQTDRVTSRESQPETGNLTTVKTACLGTHSVCWAFSHHMMTKAAR